MERWKLEATKEGLLKIKNVSSNSNVIKACMKKPAIKISKLYKVKKVTVFAALLRDVRMWCKDAVLPERLTKNNTFNYVTYQENTKKQYNDKICLFRALVLHLHGSGGPEKENTKIFTLALADYGGTNPTKAFKKDILFVENFVQLSIFVYEIDFLHRARIGELTRASVSKHSSTVRLLRCNSHFAMCPISRPFLNSINAHRLINLIIKLGTRRSFWELARNELGIFSPKTCISSVKHSFKNLTHLVSLKETSRNSSLTWSFQTLKQSVWKIQISRIPKKTHGLGNTFHFWYRYRPIW